MLTRMIHWSLKMTKLEGNRICIHLLSKMTVFKVYCCRRGSVFLGKILLSYSNSLIEIRIPSELKVVYGSGYLHTQLEDHTDGCLSKQLSLKVSNFLLIYFQLDKDITLRFHYSAQLTSQWVLFAFDHVQGQETADNI